MIHCTYRKRKGLGWCTNFHFMGIMFQINWNKMSYLCLSLLLWLTIIFCLFVSLFFAVFLSMFIPTSLTISFSPSIFAYLYFSIYPFIFLSSFRSISSYLSIFLFCVFISMSVSNFLSLYLSFYDCIYLISVYIYIYLHFSLYLYLSFSVYISYLSINLSILLYKPIFLSIYLSLYLYKQRYISFCILQRFDQQKRKFIYKITRIIVDICIVKLILYKSFIQKNFGYFFLLYQSTLVQIPIFLIQQLFLGCFLANFDTQYGKLGAFGVEKFIQKFYIFLKDLPESFSTSLRCLVFLLFDHRWTSVQCCIKDTFCFCKENVNYFEK